MAKTNKNMTSLSRRIVVQITLFTLALSVIYGLISFILLYTLEDGFIERDILQEVQYLTANYQQAGQWPATRNTSMKLHFSKQSFPEDIRQKSIDEPLRKEFYGLQGRHYHVHTLTDFEQTYLVAEVSNNLLVRPIREGIIQFLVISGLMVTIFAGLMAWLLSRRTTRPLKQLAELVDGVAPEQLPNTFAHQFPNNEIGTLATALEQSMIRIADAINREKCFTRDASHELRTPLAVIQNAGEVLQSSSQALSEQQQAVISRIVNASIQMEKTVTTLLVLAREEHSSASNEPVKLMPIVEQSVLDNCHLIEQKPIEVTIDDSCNISVLARSEVLAVLLNNVVSNAFQHTQQGQVTISYKDQTLAIKDTGSGIESGIADKITEPAVKGSQSAGFGFGLSIVKRLCEYQGWHFSVENYQQKDSSGTCVSVKF